MSPWLVSLPTVAVHTVFVYLFLILLLRLVGQRQLGQLSVIDLVIIIILGSAVETSMVAGNVSLPAGFVSAGTLLLTNRLITLIMRRNRRLCHLLAGGPILLVHDGKLEEHRLNRIGLTLDDLSEAIRERGYKGLDDVKFCVMESDGEINVVPKHEESFRGSRDIRKKQDAPPAAPGSGPVKKAKK